MFQNFMNVMFLKYLIFNKRKIWAEDEAQWYNTWYFLSPTLQEGRKGRRERGEREEGRSEGEEGKEREEKGHNKMNICIKIICAIT